jgi:hypothetical protein
LACTLTYRSLDDLRWRECAERHGTSPFQQPWWLDALVNAYGLHGAVAVASGPGEVVAAALPLIQSRLPGRRRLTALPFTDTFEPVAVDRGSRDRLLAGLAQAPCPPIIVRTGVWMAGWNVRALGTVRTVDLSEGAAGVLSGAAAKTRRNVKRAQRPRSGLSARLIQTRGEFMGGHLRLIAATRQRLGAPTQPRAYWKQIWRLHEGGHAITVGVYLDRRLVASGVFLLGIGEAVYKHGASDRASWPLRANYLMLACAYDELAARGMRTLSFGVTDSANRTLREFKARWGGEESTVHYSSTDARALPHRLEPGRLLGEAIRRLPPLVSRAVGSLGYPLAG